MKLKVLFLVNCESSKYIAKLFPLSIIAGNAHFKNEQSSHRLEKHLNLEGFLEKSLKIKFALKSTGKSCKGLEKSLNSSIFCRK